MLRRLLEFTRTLPRRFALIMFWALPAVGIGVHTPHASFVATFIPACSGPGVAPTVRTRFASAARPAPRPKSSYVEVYDRGRKPDRTYELLGEVGVLSHSSHTSTEELTACAKRAAHQMGGDAIVDVWLDDAASVRPTAGEQGMLYLTASVVRWQ